MQGHLNGELASSRAWYQYLGDVIAGSLKYGVNAVGLRIRVMLQALKREKEVGSDSQVDSQVPV